MSLIATPSKNTTTATTLTANAWPSTVCCFGRGLCLDVANRTPRCSSSRFVTMTMDWKLKEMIIRDLDRFVERKGLYKSVEKAWKRGYLLSDPLEGNRVGLLNVDGYYNSLLSFIDKDWRKASLAPKLAT
ncbi:AAA-ATPase protein [Vigna angularis]|uniref:AAA-ATPase protein n=1 Tax=Phaseolus angularis TaxID=3914 RepID=A0A8T0JHQ8_PHAAN|nr:AAA-ATPase protein [Vigna angularis]